jgi:hypothetical protein
MSKDAFATPTIHMNGTGATMLVDGYEAASSALQAFQDAFDRVEFNARDYYVQGPDAWSQALDEREAVFSKIREIEGYLNAIRGSLCEQVEAREGLKSGGARL